MIKASKKVWKNLEGKLWAQVLTALFAGLIVGIFMGPDLNLIARDVAIKVSHWLALPGYFFLAIIQMIVIPLIISSVICGIAAGKNVDNIKTLGVKILFYFIFTTTIAVSIGGALVTATQPGKAFDPEILGIDMSTAQAPDINQALTDTSNIPKRIVELIPRNPFDSFASGEMLQIVIFAAVLGAALLFMQRKKAASLLDIFTATQEACMVIVGWILRLAPVAVFGLICQLTTKMGIDALYGMSLYMGTVIAGLIGVLTFYILMISLIGKKNPLQFFAQIKEAQLIAFSTSSSSATMPVTLRTAEEKVKINPTIARFVVPLGTTINMDGTALYQTIAAVFLAQVFGIDIGLFEMITILITAIAASVGTPGTPGVGIVVLASILTSVGVPAEGIAIIIGVDRILDMCRTTINVTGDLTACVIMERWNSKK